MTSATLTRPGAPGAGPVTGPAPAGPTGSTGALLFLLATAGYLAIGAWLAARGVVDAGNLSRTLSAYHPWFGREPRLAAMGFSWRPLPVLVQMPLAPVVRLWPAAGAGGLIGLLPSACFTAASAVQLRSVLRFLGCPGWVAVGLAIGFAVNPEIVFLAASGSDQPIWIFFLILTASALVRWVRTENAAALAGCGLALAGAYLCRPAGIGAALAVLAVVVPRSRHRASGPAAERGHRTLADCLVLVLPLVTAALVWSLAGWVVTGHLPPTGAVAPDRILQLPGSHALTGAWPARGRQSARPALDLMPALPVLLFAAICLAGLTRRRWALTALAPALGGWVFSATVVASGHEFALLDASVPAVLAGVLAGGVLGSTPRASERPAADPVFGVIAVLAVLLAVPVGVQTVLLHPPVARSPLEADYLLPALSPTRATAQQRQVLLRVRQDRSLAAWLDGRRLPAGSVAVDPADASGVMLGSARPRQFLASSDSDYPARVAAPGRSGVRYLLTRQPAWGTHPDAVAGVVDGANRRRFRLVRVEPNPGDLPSWQVYELRRPG